jgi:hypothetical protein
LMGVENGERRLSFIEKLKYAFAIGFEPPKLTDEDRVAIKRVGDSVSRRRMEIPAIISLESLRPMNFLASQVMVMLRPFVDMIADDTFFVACQTAFEKRESVGFLIEYLEDRLNKRKLNEKAGLRVISPDTDKASEGERGVDGKI